MVREHKTAAAFVMTTCGLIAWTVITVLSGSPLVSYGQIADQIRAAKTLSYSMEVLVPGRPAPVKSRFMLKEPGHFRIETDAPSKTVVIFDLASGKSLTLLPELKSARLESGATAADGSRPVSADNLTNVKTLFGGEGKAIEGREIDGIRTNGFETRHGDLTADLFVNPKSGVPLLAEISMKRDGAQLKSTLDNFKVDEPLDDALFSLTPPEGYTLQTSTATPLAVGHISSTLVDFLRGYSKKTGGMFPAKLDDWGSIVIPLTKDSTDGKLDAETQKILADLGSLTAQLSVLEKGKDFDYLPGDAKLGDANKIVFWIRAKNKETYEAVYGDLTSKEIEPAELQKK